MLLPVGLIALAVAFCGVMAYGTHPAWINCPHGLAIIILARRVQWLMAGLAIVSSLALLVLVISGRRRAWWLIGLAPVLALFVHRFATADVNQFAVADEPMLVAADAARFVNDEDYVVGVMFGDDAYAYPYAALYRSPVAVQTDGDRRMLLMWCASANAAVATTVNHEFKARDLDIVCAPANALLIYHERAGQFINGLTGRTPDGGKPQGFGERLAVWKMSWRDWRSLHPATRVMAIAPGNESAPKTPIVPHQPLAPDVGSATTQTGVIVIGSAHPAAIAPQQVGLQPLNLRADGVPVFVIRDPQSGVVRAFDRRLEPDLAPRFVLNHDAKRKALLVDVDTNTGWNAAGVAVDGDKARIGKRLTAVDVQEDVYYGVAKYWWPELTIQEPTTQAAPETTAPAAPPPPARPHNKKRRR